MTIVAMKDSENPKTVTTEWRNDGKFNRILVICYHLKMIYQKSNIY